MKKLILGALCAILPLMTFAQKNYPLEMRQEVVSFEENDYHYSIFIYRDADSTAAYYLSLAYHFVPLEISSLDGSFSSEIGFDEETSLCLGSNYDAALEKLNEILEMYDCEPGTVASFDSRLSVGILRKLGPVTPTQCMVVKKLFGGKKLLFALPNSKIVDNVELKKSNLKTIITNFKLDRRFNGKYHLLSEE